MGGGYRVRLVSPDGAQEHPAAELPELLAKVRADDADPHTFVWVDVPVPDAEAARMLHDVFDIHELAVKDALHRNRVPRVHVYPSHVFVILHTPELGKAGHVHYVELDQFIGRHYLVTVHGPVNKFVPLEVPQREVESVLRRMATGRLRPKTPHDLSYALTSTIARLQEAFIEKLTVEVWRLEQEVTWRERKDAEVFLEELFQTRHGLVAVATMAGLGAEIYGRIVALGRSGSPAAERLDADIVDQFERLQHLATQQRQYLQGVIEFYRTRTDTQMAIAAERLAVVAVVTLPITALSSIVGMNVIVNDSTQPVPLVLLLVVMAIGSSILLTWAKRRGWW
jgi:magnesium transporter